MVEKERPKISNHTAANAICGHAVSTYMPITKSAKKALRQNKTHKTRNLKTKRELKGALKKMEALLASQNNEEAKKSLPQIYKTLDKAAKRGVIKPNTAARKKSRITKRIPRG